MTDVRATPLAVSGSASPDVGRLLWVDVARGYAVLAVVVFHVVQWSFAHWDVTGAIGLGWESLGYGLSVIRMPLLLAVSGLVLARHVRGGLRRETTLFRAASTYYLFAVWTVLYLVFARLTTASTWRPEWAESGTLLQLVVPLSPLWYLGAMAVYVLVLSALHRAPPAVVLAPLLVLTVICTAANSSDFQTWMSIPQYALYFAVGVYLRDGLTRWATTHRTLWVVGLAIASLASLGASRLGFLQTVRPALVVTAGLAGLLVAVAAFARSTSVPALAAPGVFLGRRTLALYVTHPLVVQVVLWAVDGHPAVRAALRGSYLSPVAPILLTLVCVAVALATDRIVRQTGLTLLLEPPPVLRRAFGR